MRSKESKGAGAWCHFRSLVTVTVPDPFLLKASLDKNGLPVEAPPPLQAEVIMSLATNTFRDLKRAFRRGMHPYSNESLLEDLGTTPNRQVSSLRSNRG